MFRLTRSPSTFVSLVFQIHYLILVSEDYFRVLVFNLDQRLDSLVMLSAAATLTKTLLESASTFSERPRYYPFAYLYWSIEFVDCLLRTRSQ